MAMNDFGVALAALGEQDTSPERLKQAMLAFRAALGSHWRAISNGMGGHHN